MTEFNNPDKFFLSGFNISVLRDLNKQIREYFLDLNVFNENKRGILDKHTAVLFAKIKTIHAGLKSQNIFTQGIENRKFEELVKKYKENNEKVVTENTNSANELNNVITAKKERFTELINALFSPENKNFIFADNTKAENSYTFPKAKIINDNSVLPKKTFPTFGEDIVPDDTYAIEYINQGSVQPFKVKDNDGNLIDLETPNGAKVFTGWSIKSKNGYIPDPTKTYSPSLPSDVVDKPLFDAFYNNKLEPPPGAIKFFIEKLHGAYSDFSPFKMNKIKSSTASGFNDNLSNRAVFAAYIETFNDNYNVNAQDINLLGHSESFPIYESTKRNVTLTFSIISDYSLEMLLSLQKIYQELSIDNNLQSKIEQVRRLTYYDQGLGFTGTPFGVADAGYQAVFSDTPETLWKKITFLAQCCYPYYRNDGKLKEQPFVRFRLGDWFDLTGMIKSLSIDTDSYESALDLNPSNIGVIPFSVKVTLNIDVYHDSEPTSTFWGFYHRLEFDNGSANKQTGKGLFKDKDGKGYGNVNTRMEDENKEVKTTSEVNKREWAPIEKMAYDEIGIFQTQYQQILAQPINIPEMKRQADAKNSLTTLDRINKLSDKLRELYGYTNKTSSQVLNEANNNLFGDNLSELREYQSAIENVYGGLNANVNNIGRIATEVDQKLKKVGLDVKGSEAVNNAIEKINKIKPSNIIPKTFGDIIGYVPPKK